MYRTSKMIEVIDGCNVPKGKHYAIIVYTQLSVDDGWGGSNFNKVCKHYVTENIDIWKEEINYLGSEAAKVKYSIPEPFRAFIVEQTAEVTTEIVVKIG